MRASLSQAKSRLNELQKKVKLLNLRINQTLLWRFLVFSIPAILQ